VSGRRAPTTGPYVVPLDLPVPPRRPLKVAFVVNPTARHGRSRAAQARLPERARALGLDAAFFTTERPRHGVDLARAAAPDYDLVVAVGGDGTVHETATGLVLAGDACRAALGVLPFGTGNDFAKLLGAGHPAGERKAKGEAALDALVGAPERAFDYAWLRWTNADGSTGEEPFVNAVGLGFDGYIATLAPRYKALGGTLAYVAAVFAALGGFRPPHAQITVDGAPYADGPVYLVTAANGTCSGGGFYLTPNARADDGLLDVCALDGVTIPRLLWLLPKALRGRHLGQRDVRFRQGCSLEATFAQPVAVHTDGEVQSDAVVQARVEIVPGGLRVRG